MRLRLLLAAAILATAVPAGFAHAGSTCDTSIIFFSGYGVVDPTTGKPVETPAGEVGYGPSDLGSIDCELVQSGQDTHIVYPGSNWFMVRWGLSSQPSSGTVTFAGKTYDLTFTLTALPGNVGAFWDTPDYFFDQTDSINGGVVSINVCADAGDCQHQEYHTLG